MSVTMHHSEETAEPIDVVEHVVSARQYPYDRPFGDELVTEIMCSWCDLRVWCNWRPEEEILAFAWGFGAKVPDYIRPQVYQLLGLVNERLALGHFDLVHEEGLVSFRHSLLLSGTPELGSAQIEHLFDLAMKECERFYPALQSVLWAGKTPKEAMEAALFETVGRA